MTETQTKTKNRIKTKLVLDILIFSAFLIAMEPRSSGITIHEWLAASLIAVLVVHLLLSWDWITQITRHFIGKINNQSRLNYILNWSLLIDGTAIMLSGVYDLRIIDAVFGDSIASQFCMARSV